MQLKKALFVAFIMTSTINYAEVGKMVDNFDLEPTILHSDNSESYMLGVQYAIDGKLLNKKFDAKEGEDLNPDVAWGC
ncbi:MAG: hypothetical protein GKR87_13480 [Kiritimatiellae bacterium]|nr:hypothetical protein [Kiritimatiellia bacterium]